MNLPALVEASDLGDHLPRDHRGQGIDEEGAVKELAEQRPRRAGQAVTVNPEGPDSSYDPRQPTIPKRVTRGGSFLCDTHYCASYRPSARTKVSPDTSLVHTGFRCLMTPAMAAQAATAQGQTLAAAPARP